MNLKELKKTILLSLYNRYKQDNKKVLSFTELCDEEGISYDSLSQLSSAMASLKDSGYISATFFISGDGVVTELTANGIEFVEENILLGEPQPIIKQDDEVEEEILHSVDTNNEDANSEIPINKRYQTKEKIKEIRDTEVEPCFSVNDLADCFIKQIDKIAESKSENTPMLGVFAPWGRGKSYLLNRVFDVLNTRKDENAKKYNIITFNAWKYQDTPAIWAYLYECLYKCATWWQRLFLQLLKYFCSTSFWFFIFVIALSCILKYCTPMFTETLSKYNSILTDFWWSPPLIAFVFSILHTIGNNPIKAFKIINKYTKRRTYKEHLGIQNDIEEDLARLITSLSWRKGKVLLLVDDIDRCSTDKMVNIVDSLRTILENKTIREKLIIICSIDVEKLKNGYINAFPSNIPEEKRKILAREQIDKLFIFTMGLAPLGLSQQQEYMRKIMNIKGADGNPYIENTLIDTGRQEGALYVATDVEEEPKVLSDFDIYKEVSIYLKQHKINATPRKLRIIYYQILFANNILSKSGTGISNSFISMLLSRSLGVNEEFSNDTALGDVIDMAVPY